MSKDLFITVYNGTTYEAEEVYSVVKDMNNMMATYTTFKKAYKIGLERAGIKDPDLSYRQALARYNQDGHVYIKPTVIEDPDQQLLITRIKQY